MSENLANIRPEQWRSEASPFALEIVADMNTELSARRILQLTEAQQFVVCAAVEGMLEAIEKIKKANEK